MSVGNELTINDVDGELNDDLDGGEGNDHFSFYATGDFTVSSFENNVDTLTFETEHTGLHNIDELLSVISSIEDTNDGVVIHFVNDVASITLVGLHMGDLSADMVEFTAPIV